jgi:hypothetical protein
VRIKFAFVELGPTQGLAHVRQVFYHWATPPASPLKISKVEREKTVLCYIMEGDQTVRKDDHRIYRHTLEIGLSEMPLDWKARLRGMVGQWGRAVSSCPALLCSPGKSPSGKRCTSTWLSQIPRYYYASHYPTLPFFDSSTLDASLGFLSPPLKQLPSQQCFGSDLRTKSPVSGRWQSSPSQRLLSFCNHKSFYKDRTEALVSSAQSLASWNKLHKKNKVQPGVVAHACNPSAEVEIGLQDPGQPFLRDSCQKKKIHS